MLNNYIPIMNNNPVLPVCLLQHRVNHGFHGNTIKHYNFYNKLK